MQHVTWFCRCDQCKRNSSETGGYGDGETQHRRCSSPSDAWRQAEEHGLSDDAQMWYTDETGQTVAGGQPGSTCAEGISPDEFRRRFIDGE